MYSPALAGPKDVSFVTTERDPAEAGEYSLFLTPQQSCGVLKIISYGSAHTKQKRSINAPLQKNYEERKGFPGDRAGTAM